MKKNELLKLKEKLEEIIENNDKTKIQLYKKLKLEFEILYKKVKHARI